MVLNGVRIRSSERARFLAKSLLNSKPGMIGYFHLGLTTQATLDTPACIENTLRSWGKLSCYSQNGYREAGYSPIQQAYKINVELRLQLIYERKAAQPKSDSL